MAVKDTKLHTAYIVSNTRVGDGIYELVLVCDELARTMLPGEFINIHVPGSQTELLSIPLSFSHIDVEAGLIYLAYAVVGSGTKRLSALGAKTALRVLGPCGHGWDMPLSKEKALLVSGGIGTPPVLAAAALFKSQGIAVDVIIGAQTADKLWGVKRAHAIGVDRLFLTTDDGTLGEKGFTTDVMQKLLAETSYGCVCTCGPAPMMKRVAALAKAAHIPCQASLERMMTCGFGACATCTVQMVDGSNKGCCMVGPVFNAEEVAW